MVNSAEPVDEFKCDNPSCPTPWKDWKVTVCSYGPEFPARSYCSKECKGSCAVFPLAPLGIWGGEEELNYIVREEKAGLSAQEVLQNTEEENISLILIPSRSQASPTGPNLITLSPLPFLSGIQLREEHLAESLASVKIEHTQSGSGQIIEIGSFKIMIMENTAGMTIGCTVEYSHSRQIGFFMTPFGSSCAHKNDATDVLELA
ncbi:hypothetical protein B0H17DRAFT_1151367 [Mycena rosella]|uniref:Uncharacterized protein n=1 Tax=Mycena rosella TaxID=1033263 RepID=A0AAD7BKT9_MYCRO|nr:hypothetical protein B0H17DRAFT_1151367 [Mycena rosella]